MSWHPRAPSPSGIGASADARPHKSFHPPEPVRLQRLKNKSRARSPESKGRGREPDERTEGRRSARGLCERFTIDKLSRKREHISRRTKSLSVNRNRLAPTNHGRSQGQQGDVACFGLFKTH